jgi:hypothetical protein
MYRMARLLFLQAEAAEAALPEARGHRLRLLERARDFHLALRCRPGGTVGNHPLSLESRSRCDDGAHWGEASRVRPQLPIFLAPEGALSLRRPLARKLARSVGYSPQS